MRGTSPAFALPIRAPEIVGARARNGAWRPDEDGLEAVAQAILDTLGIDPLLSAEMIWRSSDDVWDRIRDDVISFVRNRNCNDKRTSFC